MRTHRLVPALALLALAGCQHDEAFITDSVDLNFDFSYAAGVTQELNGPYVRGAEFRVWAGRSRASDETLRGWRLKVDDPTIFELTPEDDFARARGHALRAGETWIRAIDREGDVRATDLIRVVVPDRVELVAHGPLFVGDSMDDARTTHPHVLAGGTATFLVRYFSGDEELHGHGVLEALPTDGLEALERQSFLFEDREWLSLTPGVAGDHAVRLLADGVDLGEVPVTAVTEDDIAMIDVRGEEDGAGRGDGLTALGQAYLGDGTPVYGVAFAWALDLEPLEGQGDLFLYDYAPDQVSVLDAHGAGQTGTAIVHADEGTVSSSNNVGCAVAPGGRGRGAGAGLCLGIGLVLGLAIVPRTRHAFRH